MSLSNGIAWSPDGETIYHVDTFARTVSSHAYHNNYWDPEAWTPVITAFAGYPDGLTVDSGGTLWVAVWGDGVVQQFAASGELLTVVEVETPLVSCAGFVGNGLDRLAITTSSEGATQCAGAIFVSDVHRTGIPESRWIGSTTHPYWLEEGGS